MSASSSTSLASSPTNATAQCSICPTSRKGKTTTWKNSKASRTRFKTWCVIQLTKSPLIPFDSVTPNGLTLSLSTPPKELPSQSQDKLHLLDSVTIHLTHGGQDKELIQGYTPEQTKPNFIQLGNHALNIDIINAIFASYTDTSSGIVPNTPVNIARKLADTSPTSVWRIPDTTTAPIVLRHTNKSPLSMRLELKECEKLNATESWRRLKRFQLKFSLNTL